MEHPNVKTTLIFDAKYIDPTITIGSTGTRNKALIVQSMPEVFLSYYNWQTNEGGAKKQFVGIFDCLH